MERYFVQISFKGTHYHGWQIQPNAITVQKIVEKALRTLTGEKITAVGAGRTDTGVHASFFIFHFDTINNIDTDMLTYRLNGYLPSDISICNIRKVSSDAHARFSAISRTYRYYITQIKDPFREETAYYYPGRLNMDKMNEAASLLKNYTDFTSFSRLHTDVKTNFCKILEAQWQKEGHMLVFNIEADRFLRNMVRAIVGTLLLTGREKINIDDFRIIIESRNRSSAGPSAPACGLFLSEINYPDFINTG